MNPRLTEIFELARNAATGKIKAEIDINAADIEIGAVEIKDATTDQRAAVNVNGGVKAAIDQTTANANEVVTKTGSVTAATLGAETTKVIGTVNDKVADGDDITQGAKADAAATVGDATPFSVIALLKGIFNKLGAVVLAAGTALIGKVDINSNLIAASKVIEIQTHFAKNTAAGTEQTAVQIPKPTNPVLMYKAAMSNSSIDSALTVKLFNRRTFNVTGTARAIADITGTATAGDATHITLAAGSSASDDIYNGMTIEITDGTGVGQSKTIVDYVGGTLVAEVSAWTVNPDNTSVYAIKDTMHIALAATANPTNDHYNTFVVSITSGTGSGQSKTISDYVGATVTALVNSAWTTQPDATSVYNIAMIRDSLAWSGNFAKASLTAPIVKANDSSIITGLFDNGCDVYYVVSNDVLIANADASRFSCVFQLIPVA